MNHIHCYSIIYSILHESYVIVIVCQRVLYAAKLQALPLGCNNWSECERTPVLVMLTAIYILWYVHCAAYSMFIQFNRSQVQIYMYAWVNHGTSCTHYVFWRKSRGEYC